MADEATRCEFCLTLALVVALSFARVEAVSNLASMEVKLVCYAPSVNPVNRHVASLACMTLCLPAEALFDYLGPSLVSALWESEAVAHL